MKQKLKLFSVVLIVLETICLFIPLCFKSIYHNYGTISIENVNIFNVSTTLGTILSIIVIILLLFSFVAYLLSLLQKKIKYTNLYFYSSIVSFLALVGFAVYADRFASIHYTYGFHFQSWSINWLFYVIIVLHIVTIIFSVFIRFRKFEDIILKESNQEEKSNNSVSSADELKKFKELLDMGAITQEEFDAKKKQLLGL